MKIIVAGAGSVGSLLANQLSQENNDVTVIDVDGKQLHEMENKMDVMSTVGNCATMDVLMRAGADTADLFIAATSEDERNLLACMTAHAINPNIHTIARVMNPDYNMSIPRIADMLALSLMVNPAKQAALEIVRILRFPGFLKRETFAKGRVEIVELKIEEGSELAGKSMIEFAKAYEANVLVCTVLRNGEAVIPKGDYRMEVGDRIFVTGMPPELTKLLRELGIVPKKTKRVVICGGGKTAFYVAQELLKHHIEVQIIEPDYDRCRDLVTQLPGVNVINGNPSDESVLEGEGVDSCDALVSLSKRDELNIITSLYGKSQGVPLVITKLESTADSRMIEKLDVGSVISPKYICATDIIRYVRAMRNHQGAAKSVHAIAAGHAEALEFKINNGMKYVGTPLMNIPLKKDLLICCITHNMNHELPTGKSMFFPGDTVIVVKSGDTVIESFEDIFRE